MRFGLLMTVLLALSEFAFADTPIQLPPKDGTESLPDIMPDLPERGGVEIPEDRGLPEEPDDFDEPEESFDLLEDDFDMDSMPEPPDAPLRSAVQAPQRIGAISLDVAGMTPLVGNYPIDIVNIDRDSVVIELPVLVARSRYELQSPFTLAFDVVANEVLVAQMKQDITAAALAEYGPSFCFAKIMVPVTEGIGDISVTVSKVDEAGASVELFTTVTPYAL